MACLAFHTSVLYYQIMIPPFIFLFFTLFFPAFSFTQEQNSNSAVLSLENNQTAQTEISQINLLENFTKEKSPLEIHNKALHLLKNKQKEQAFLLLKKNIYQNLFLPSYFVLFHFEIPIFFSAFLWHISLAFLAVICLFSLFLSFKEPSPFNLKIFSACLTLGLVFSSSGFWLLKKRVSSFQEIDLRSSPFREAPIQASLRPNSDLIVLKQVGDWLIVKSKNKQTGWLKKQKVFQIF